MRAVILACLLFTVMTFSSYADEIDSLFYNHAFVRALSPTFENSLKINPPPTPINYDKAVEQHKNYIELLLTLIPSVTEFEGDQDHPDCNFIEDTAIVVGDVVVISYMGAPERRGEELPIKEAFKKLPSKTLYQLEAPATMDGGDILYTGKHLLVGLSKRTNRQALDQLKEIFHGTLEVVGIPVTEGLHLKSVISFFDTDTLVVADTKAGKEIQAHIEAIALYKFITVPDVVASNVLRIGYTVVMQEGYPASEKVLQDACHNLHFRLVKLDMSELVKADGALTCGSLLFNN